MRKHGTLLRRYLGYFIVVALSVGIISVYAAAQFSRASYRRTAEILDRANLVTRNLMLHGGYEEINTFLNDIAVEDVRITVIRDDGVVVADSQADVSSLDNHATRPEIVAALNGLPGQSKRFSDSLGMDMLYVALPVFAFGDREYVVRSSMSVQNIDRSVRALVARIAVTGLMTFLAISILAFLSERRLIAPFADIQKAAEAYSAGNLDYYLIVPSPEDARVVADTLNRMAAGIREQIAEITERRNELNAIFSSMVEAVVVLDAGLNVLQLNSSALRIVGAEESQALGRNLIEVFRNTELCAFAEETLRASGPMERSVALNGSDREIVLQVHGTHLPLSGRRSEEDAIVLVMNDITRIQRLENMRRDFVANVSHELKTPITTIKGYLETLSDGAFEDADTARRFLGIANRNADRLNAILDDLLSLSRLEQRGGEGLEFESGSLEGLASSAIQACAPKAAEKDIRIELEAEGSTRAEVNPLLVEQAIANLIDNAVKYSEAGSSVSVRVSGEGERVTVSVSDTGIGIPEKDIPRIFERFYRVDKARSRELGGTGLGLAIVKHIAIVHSGTVAVESRIGWGSVFTLELPAKRAML
jgi:two-component system phosphate regulon sensor histidine kinase PhoR